MKKLLYFLIFFTLPFNLGHHFIGKWSYIYGLLKDYLIPTIYLQDVLIATLLIFSFFMYIKKRLNKRSEKSPAKKLTKIASKAQIESLLEILKKPIFQKEDKYLIWFVFGVALSSIYGELGILSLALTLRFFLYLVFFFLLRQDLKNQNLSPDFILKTVLISTTLILLIAFLQFFKQGALFNNYLFFGEQPYEKHDYGISRENIFGKEIVGSYSTFRHPNTFAGFLILTLFFIRNFYKNFKYKKHLTLIVFFGILITFSKTALLGFLTVLFLEKQKQHKTVLFLVIFSSLSFVYLSSFDVFSFITQKTFFYQRADLLTASWEIFKINPLLGVGFFSSFTYFNDFLPKGHNFVFLQPVHNIFVMILVEFGLLGFLLFFKFLRKIWHKSKDFVVIIVVLGSFDHYILTMHQIILFTFILLALISARQELAVDT